MMLAQSLVLVAGLLSTSQAFSLFTSHRRIPTEQGVVPDLEIGGSAGGVVQLDTQRKQLWGHPVQRDRLRFAKRAGTLQETLDNELTLYYADVELGSPQQQLRLDIDTGSSDLWTNAASSYLCQRYSQQCAQSGTYSANRSSTYQYVNSAFYIRYADGSYAIGDYAKDTLSIGGVDVTGLQFGIGYNSTSIQGILGIGYASNEAAISTTGRTYANLPQLLVQQGYTNTMAYSLWLNDLDANTGSVLFGGVDTAKYKGTLSTLPIIRESGTYREFIIGLSSVTAAGQTIFSNDPVPVLLDSGASLTYLPDSYAQAIFRVFSATYSSDSGAAVVSCSLRGSSATVDFSFSGVTIKVDMTELVLIEGYRRGQPSCILGISAAGSSTSVLGDTFLRSAYVVYDLTNNNIAIAPTNFNATDSNIQTIQSGSGIPGATVVSGAVSTLAVTTGGARNAGPSVTAGSFASSSSSRAGVAKATAPPMMYGQFAAAAVAGLAMAL